MSYPPPSRARSGPRRRTLLASAAGAAVLLAGCTSGTGSDGGTSSPSARARKRAAADSGTLLARYDAVLAAHPGLDERISPLRAAVAAHVAAFGGKAAPSASASPAASASTSPSATGDTDGTDDAKHGEAKHGEKAASAGPGVSPGPVPTTEKDALAWLATAERTLADRRTKALLDVPGELARLMASVAAAGAAHAFVLTEGDK
ncbi:hypothetical protein [Streptomyces sp. LaPpAH-108]|uniref:hypothetical protein n=1 Tax=Streptomyces sp. LaPpAH-108 TaxID=1155714 RepID=UPI0003824191|nr:hypothetical protein [Streptomyces sp. LaPpAH-108]